MPTNNGNVTRAAVGVAKRLSNANFNANVKPGVLGVKHYGAGRQGRQGQTKSPRRDAGGRDRGSDLGRDQLGHLEAVEGVSPCGDCRDRSFIPKGRDLSRFVVSLQQH